jgi:exodeoxyribonuclease VII small subunit
VAKRTTAPVAGEAGPPAMEELLQRLEAIATRLESGGLPLEDALALYREARDLHAACVARLGEAERELQILMADGETRGERAAEPAPPQDES